MLTKPLYEIHLFWRVHDRLARVHPKPGEVIAFRNVISSIPVDSPVDEISIQAYSSLTFSTSNMEEVLTHEA